MRIGFDARYISHGLTGGVRAYVYHLARELPCVGQEHTFFYYADAKAPFELTKIPANVTLRILPWRSRLSSIWNDYRIARWMERDALDVVHAPGNYGPVVTAPLVVTLHDSLNLLPLSEHLRGFGRSPYQIGLMAYLGYQTRATLQRAARLIAVSEHARRDIAARSCYPIDRIAPIHSAADETFRVIDDEKMLEAVRSRLGLPTRFLLADGIKNPAVVVEAYRQLPRRLLVNTEVVFFSREPRPRPQVAEALREPGFRFIAQPNSSDLAVLMNLASVFVFPSFYEGFGIPLVEAMCCGLPIVASTRGSIPEITGGAALLFALEEPGALVRHLESVLGSSDVAGQLRTEGLRRGRSFSWTTTAERTIRIYTEVAAAGPTVIR